MRLPDIAKRRREDAFDGMQGSMLPCLVKFERFFSVSSVPSLCAQW